MSAVYVSIGRLEPSWPQTQFSDAWVQLGYRRVRFAEAPGQVIIRTERYAENMKGPDPQADYLYWFSPPPPAGIWNYRIIYIEIANELDCWEFQWDDGVPPLDIPQRTCEPYWNGRKGGNDVVWMGELLNREDRLAGLAESRCVFSLCKYQYDFSGSPEFPNFTQDDEFWGGDGNPGIIHYSLNRLSTSGFEIWDNIP